MDKDSAIPGSADVAVGYLDAAPGTPVRGILALSPAVASAVAAKGEVAGPVAVTLRALLADLGPGDARMRLVTLVAVGAHTAASRLAHRQSCLDRVCATAHSDARGQHAVGALAAAAAPRSRPPGTAGKGRLIVGIVGWIHHHDRDLREERDTLNSMARAATTAPHVDGALLLTPRAGFGHCGRGTGYADWRRPDRPEPDQVVLIDTAPTTGVVWRGIVRTAPATGWGSRAAATRLPAVG